MEEDLEAYKIVREAVGPAVHVMTDYSQGLSSAEALRRMHALDDKGVYWFEAPNTQNSEVRIRPCPPD